MHLSPMNLSAALTQGEYDSHLQAVYGADTSVAAARLSEVAKDFAEVFSDDERDLSLFSTPGRTEICGNHTDHNHGICMTGSIGLDVIAVAAKNDDAVIRVKSAGYDMDEVRLDELEVHKDAFSKSSELIRGIVARFTQLGYKTGGFDATTASQVLKGSGMSSSAAFEVLICTMLNHLYNDGAIDAVELAKISQYAENVYFGKPCGLMDQIACAVGGFVFIDFYDPAEPVVKKVDFDFDGCAHSLCIVDTKGDHADLTEDYAAVRGEMESVAACLGKAVLREVDEKEFEKNIASVRQQCSDRAVLRAMHFFAENKRVERQLQNLSAGDFEAFKQTEIESGYSSYMYNQNVYTCKQPSSQPVSVGLALSEKLLSGKGAWRVHGGGFAGTIQAFVPDSLTQEYTAAMEAVFGKGSCYHLSIRSAGGVKLL